MGKRPWKIHENILALEELKEVDWLRYNIFYTTCTVKGKVCWVIIDSGNCEQGSKYQYVYAVSAISDPINRKF